MSSVLEPVGTAEPIPPRDDILYEVVNGEIVELPPMAAYEMWLANRLSYRLNSHAQPQDLGQAVIETLFRLAPGQPQRRLDVAYVSYERWPKDRPAPETNAWDVVPELGIEIVSKHDPAYEVLDRVHEFFTAGMGLVWIVWPKHREVYVYESPSRIHVVSEQGTLDGGSVVPGFQIALPVLFAE
jgi:Uma2 family endonuclease